MNLIYLHKSNNDLLQLGDAVTVARHTVSGRTYDGFVLPEGSGGEVRLGSALRWHPFSARPIATDWLAIADEGPAADLEVSLLDQQGRIVSRVIDRIGAGPSVVSLPRVVEPSTLRGDRSLDLVLRNCSGTGAPITLLVSEVDKGKSFLTLAKGVGVELLTDEPPALLPSLDRDLFYVGTEARIATIGPPPQISSDQWCQSLVGTPHDIPLVDGALDFILARNVLQRAVNPFGHLSRWRTKLRDGGRLLGTVPYVAGGADYQHAATVMVDWLAQHEKGGFEETQAHHNAYAQVRGLNPKSLFRRQHASTFSFFTPANVAEMLTFAVESLGYQGMHIEHGRNSRDIRFRLFA